MDWRGVIRFWFEESKPEQWFKNNEAFDAEIRRRFADTYEAVARGDTFLWKKEPQGRLAEILVLDQFARNMFRGTPKAFAQGEMALELAEEAVYLGVDKKLPKRMRKFVYMPYMHAENREAHRKAFWLFLSLWDWETLKYEMQHARIIRRFGRYPHRNAVLGRQSSPAEKEFIATNSGF